MLNKTDFDVVICGGGLAGLTLARQLKLELPELSVAVIDRLKRPLPEAAFKVGESSVELGTFYFTQTLKLENYFREHHLRKLGLRFFMGKSQVPIEERPEMGISVYPPIPSYQIDRGRLENDLRKMVEEMGTVLFEGVVVDDIQLADREEQHLVKCHWKGEGTNFTLTSRWVIDALGRRRFLQTKLGLNRTLDHHASAAWWRYKGRVDVEALATGKNARRWRSSVVERRYFSTNHLMNRGYWVWLIPLGSDSTSVGIVTDETIHPQHTYGKSYDIALEWIREYEPVLWQYLRDKEPLDFLSLKNYSHGSAQVYSHRRWSCIGDAGFFLDPLYSIGSDFIAMGNMITVEMIHWDQMGKLTEDRVEKLNELVLGILFNICLSFYQGTYCSFGHAQIFATKLMWDTAIVWSYVYPILFQGFLREPTDAVFILGERYLELNRRIQQLYIDWSKTAPPRSTYVRADLTRMHFMQLLHFEILTSRTPEQALDVMKRNLDRFEELAQVLFWQALDECYPDHPMLKKRPWINAWRIVLDPEKWAEQGLFDTTTSPRPLKSMRDNFTGIFAPQSLRESLIYDLPYRFIHLGRGFVMYHIVSAVFKSFILGKPAIWMRKVFVRDYLSKIVQ